MHGRDNLLASDERGRPALDTSTAKPPLSSAPLALPAQPESSDDDLDDFHQSDAISWMKGMVTLAPGNLVEQLSGSGGEVDDQVSTIQNTGFVVTGDEQVPNVAGRQLNAHNTFERDPVKGQSAEITEQEVVEFEEALADIMACIFAEAMGTGSLAHQI